MLLKGSCHCSSIKFQVDSPHPYPFNFCYCSVCRKTAGGGGYAINLAGKFDTLQIEGMEHASVYHAIIDGQKSPAERHFCKHCASALWLYDARWPELVHPFASAIDTDLPVAPERTHLMLNSKAAWVQIERKKSDKCFAEYPDESITQWHERLNLT
jgi:hypothetical protein